MLQYIILLSVYDYWFWKIKSLRDYTVYCTACERRVQLKESQENNGIGEATEEVEDALVTKRSGGRANAEPVVP